MIARYAFALAQSYWDSGEKEKALEHYLRLADLGYGQDEVFMAFYNAARLKEELDHPQQEVIDAYLKASDAFPARAEALYRASRFCGGKGRNEEAFQLAKRGLAVPCPTEGLLIERRIYDWGLLDELAIHAYWSGHCRESLDASIKLLGSPVAPSAQRDRFAANARLALEKLPRDRNLGSLGSESLIDQHSLAPPRPLRSRMAGEPRILVAILAKQKEPALPLYLECIEALDYPKSSIVLYVRTNNNTDRTEPILREWVGRVGHLYAGVEFDAENVAAPVETFKVHEWNATRFSVLGRIRNISLERALERDCDFYFVSDVDNFIRPCTLSELVALDLPIVAPLLRSIGPGQFYSNYHAEIDARGYFKECDQYQWLLNRWVRGVLEMPVVHCTYLVRGDVLADLTYEDETARHEYVVFSHSARKAKIPQYLDNRQVYGYVTFAADDPMHVADGIERARALLKPDLETALAMAEGANVPSAPMSASASTPVATKPGKPRIFACFGLHGSGSTWMFNLARQICRAQGVDFVSLHRDSEANLPWDVFGSKLMIVRTHNPFPSFQTFIANCGEPAVITVRDPRDAVVSFMQRFPNSLASSFDATLKAIAHSARCLVSLSRLRKLPVFRYEDFFVGSAGTLDAIAALLATSPTADQREKILAGLEPDAVKRTIDGLEAVGVIQGEKVWDKETHWHANHVGDGKVGKYTTALSQAQQDEIVDQTREYCEIFGYDVTDDSTRRQPAEASATSVGSSKQ